LKGFVSNPFLLVFLLPETYTALNDSLYELGERLWQENLIQGRQAGINWCKNNRTYQGVLPREIRSKVEESGYSRLTPTNPSFLTMHKNFKYGWLQDVFKDSKKYKLVNIDMTNAHLLYASAYCSPSSLDVFLTEGSAWPKLMEMVPTEWKPWLVRDLLKKIIYKMLNGGGWRNIDNTVKLFHPDLVEDPEWLKQYFQVLANFPVCKDLEGLSGKLAHLGETGSLYVPSQKSPVPKKLANDEKEVRRKKELSIWEQNSSGLTSNRIVRRYISRALAGWEVCCLLELVLLLITKKAVIIALEHDGILTLVEKETWEVDFESIKETFKEITRDLVGHGLTVETKSI